MLKAPLADIGLLSLVVSLTLFALVFTLFNAGRLRRHLQKSRNDLARAEAEWVQALDVAEDAIYLTDPVGRVLRGNRKFFELVGNNAGDVIGQDARVLLHGPIQPGNGLVTEAWHSLQDRVSIREADDPGNRFERPMEIHQRIIRAADQAPVGILHVIRDLSRQRQTENALRDSEERFRMLSEAAFEGLFIHQDGIVIDVNQPLARLLGYEVQELIGRHVLEFTGDEYRNEIRNRLTTPSDTAYEIRARRRDGSCVQVELRGHYFPYQGTLQRVVAVRDITRLKDAQEAFFKEKELLMVTLESIGEAVITTDTVGRIQYLNPVAQSLTGWPGEKAVGRHLQEVFVLPDLERQAIDDPVKTCLLRDTVITSGGDRKLRRVDDEEIAIEYSTAPIRDRTGDVVGTVLVFRDVTEMRGLARQLRYQATHDDLTGLINRREFEMRLSAAHDSARLHGQQHALCYLDLDQFKVVNDTCGHIAGDELLRQLAQLLLTRMRSSDTLARLGGDEFGVLLSCCPLDKARGLAETLREVVSEFRFVWQDKAFTVGVSIGLVPISAESVSVIELLSAADAACYVSKDSGRNRVHVAQPDDVALSRHQGELHWVQRITHALEDDRLQLYCQSILPLGRQASSLRHYEILLRMVDEKGQIVLPMAFLPAAERYGHMPALDRWVIQHTLDVYHRLQENGAGNVGFSINISGPSLCEPRFLDFVTHQVSRLGKAASGICFEITETAAITNFTQARQFIHALQAMGCRFALDDFGSGLSSFGYLKNLPVNYLKIDGSFIRDMVEDPIDCAMVTAIHQLAQVMEIETIAEFVEDDAILLKLRALKIDYAQGMAIHSPRALELEFPCLNNAQRLSA